jgi:hypothetical protein
LWARREAARRWGSLALLALVLGLTSGLTMAALDGAQRAGSAYDRMRQDLRAADVLFSPSQVGAFDLDISLLATLPEVTGWAAHSRNDGQFDGLPPLLGATITDSPGWFDTVERVKVLDGRMLDPTKDDEMVVTESIAADNDFGLHVGAVFTWRHLSREQADAFAQSGLPENFDFVKDAAGPITTMHVVGVVRLPMEAVAAFSNEGLILPSPAWAAAHLADTRVYVTDAVVRLRHGAADVEQFRADLARLYGRDDLPVKDLADDVKRVEGSLRVERTALWLFAAAVALAGLVVSGQAIGRVIRASAGPSRVMAAMGASNGAMIVGLLLPVAAAVLVALGLAAAADAALSARFPIGLARQLDPAPGVHVPGTLLAVGLLVTAIVAFGAGLLASVATVRAGARGRIGRRHRAAGLGSRAGLPVPTSFGLSLAVDARPGDAVRPALVAAALGVLGVVGAATVVAGIDDAKTHPARSGAVWDWQGYADPSTDGAMLEAAPSVGGYALLARVVTQVNGFDAPVYSLTPGKAGVDFATLSGGRPGPGEAAIGPRTAHHIGVHPGDTIHVGPQDLAVRIAGTALFIQTSSSAHDEGVWLNENDMDTLFGHLGFTRQDYDAYGQTALIRIAPGVTTEQAGNDLEQMRLIDPLPSRDVANLVEVRGLPYALAAFLLLLAVAALAHALITATRRRRHDLAILGATGMSPGQAASCVLWQAIAIATIALALGVPLGIVAGRLAWQAIAGSLSLVQVAPFSAATIAVTIPVVAATVLVLAAGPAWATARRRPARALRTE